MINRAEQDIREIRNLLRTPSPENVELANQKLELVASFLTSVKNTLAAGQSCDSRSQKFLESAKGADARRQTGEELVRSSGGALDTAPVLREFLQRLPVEISAIRALLQGPMEFFRGINSLRAAKFGSYESTGVLRRLELEIPGKTLIHL